ncbi:MAG: rhomboid family intramembrane serine protease [Oscillospiraceae bacterium]|nr:rhomboid family intramembrane serine protease [Oscillospiraceae bacterium]
MIRIRYNAPVVLTFALLALLTLPLNVLTAGWTTPHLFSVYRCSLLDPLAYVRFFGHALGHSGLPHYFNNMLLMLLVGPPLEEKYGSRALLLFIAITALATGLAEFILFPNSVLLGASGVVFMMIVLSSFTSTNRGGIPLTMLLVVLLYLGGEVVNGLVNTDNISQLAHIVGGVCGMVIGFSVSGKKKRR